TNISEWEAGTEWQISSGMELTLSYLTTDRTNTTANGLAGSTSYGQFVGDVLRLQFQINY
ncbi:MAG: porin, partial [Planctomycetota bacterium]